MGPVVKLLQAIASLTRSGAIKSIDDAYRLAKRELGDTFDRYKNQIKDAFDAGNRGKKSADIIPFPKKKKQDTPDQALGLESLKNPRRPGGGLDQVTGITRALARRILDRKGIEIGKKDPIDAFTDTFGEAITDVKNLAEEMIEIDARGGGMKDMDKMLEIEGLYDIPVPKNPSKGLTDKEMLDLMEEAEQEDILKKFDPKDREPNSKGGINRVGFAKGKIKLVQFLAGKGLDFAKEIKKSVDNIFTTGDTKYDADVVVDDMVERLGIDRDVVDQTDILDAYDEAYKMLSKNKRSGKDIDLPDDVDPRDTILPTRSFKGTEIKDPKFDEDMPFDNDAEKLAEIKMSNENFDLEKGLNDLDEFNVTKDAAQAKKILDDVDEAYNVTPKMKEELALKEKYPGLDDELITAIVDDPDPDNKAQVLATLEQIEKLRKMGKTPEEAVDIISKTMFRGRKDNAEGGLNYLMGM